MAAALPPKPDPTLPRRPLTRTESAACVLSIAAWIILTIAGVAVPTKGYIDLMGTESRIAVSQLAWVFFVLITCYTFTNIAFLCCLSAIIGAVGRSARIDDARSSAETDFRTLCIAAIIRGFFMYILIVSGTLILADQKFDDISIKQYLQLAGLVSLLSFAVGYDPSLFGRLFHRVASFSESLEASRGPDRLRTWYPSIRCFPDLTSRGAGVAHSRGYRHENSRRRQ